MPANFTSGDVFVIQNGHNMTTLKAAWSISGNLLQVVDREWRHAYRNQRSYTCYSNNVPN